MEEIVRNMLEKAYEEKDLELASLVSDLLDEISTSYNPRPLEWRELPKQLAKEYKNNAWIMDAVYEFKIYANDDEEEE